MKKYTVGDNLMCDFHFGGKPDAKCIEVIEPGTGKCSGGRLRVEVTKTAGAYHKGEILSIEPFLAVPKEHVFTRGCHLRVRTNFEWIKPENHAN